MASMARSEESALRRRRRGLFGRALSRNLEYLALLIVAALVVVGAVVVVRHSDRVSPALFSGTHFPTCRAAGIVPGGTREGTCTTSHAVVTVGNEGSLVTVPGLRMRATNAKVTPATTTSGKA